MIAHIIVAAATLTLLRAWVAVVLGVLAGSALLIAELHHRRLGAAVLVASALAASAVSVITPWPPMRPAYALSVAEPRPHARVSSPVAIVVCGRLVDGTAADMPGPDRVVSLSLDGRQVEVAQSPLLALALPAGSHRLRIEILTAGHRGFAPPVAVDIPIVVAGSGALGPAARCPR